MFTEPLLAYIGPETAMPFISVIAAIFGVFLAMGKASVQMVKAKCWAVVSKVCGSSQACDNVVSSQTIEE